MATRSSGENASEGREAEGVRAGLREVGVVMEEGGETPVRFRPLNREGTWADSGHFVLRGGQKYSVLTPDGKPLSLSPGKSSDEHGRYQRTIDDLQNRLASAEVIANQMAYS